MKASGPKEHLSLTSASRCLKLGRVRVEVEAVAARKVCLSLCKSHICKFECQTSYLKLTSSEKDSSFFFDAATYEQCSEIVSVSEKPDKCL